MLVSVLKNNFITMKRLVYIALFLALPMLAIGQSAVGHYTYSHGWSQNVQEGNISVTESGTMDFYPDGSASDSALQHYVLQRPDNSIVRVDFDYLSPSYWQHEGNVLKFWGDSSCFFMVPVSVQVEYPAANVSDSVRKADKRWAYNFAWNISQTARKNIHKPYLFQVTRLDNKAMDFSYTYPDNHTDQWHFVRAGVPQGLSASEKSQQQRRFNTVDPSTLEQRAQQERGYQQNGYQERGYYEDYHPTFPKDNNFVISARVLPRMTQYDFSFSYLRNVGGVQYIGFGGSFGIVNSGLYDFTYGGIHLNLKTLFTRHGYVQPFAAFEVGYQFTPDYSSMIIYSDGVSRRRDYYPIGGYATPMLGFDFLLGNSRTRISLAFGFQLYAYDDGLYSRDRGDFMTQLGFWF